MYATTQTSRTNGQRGSALLIALVMTMSLAAIVTYAVTDTMDSHANARREDNSARALSAAEYGAELAISEVGRQIYVDDAYLRDSSRVIGDFVSGEKGDKYYRKTVDQRRIRGLFDNQEFRVRVRSARQVYGNPKDPVARDLLSRGWLKAPKNYDVKFGTIKARQFRDMYEITSTARNSTYAESTVDDTAPKVRPELMGQATVQAIVRLDWKSPLGDMLDRIGLIHMEKPSRFQLKANKTQWYDWYAKAKNGVPIPDNNLVAMADMTNQEVYNVKATGEDHYLVKYIRAITEQTVITIIQPWKLYTNQANYFGATGGYWEAGLLTLNYKMPKDESNDNNLILRDREPINPYRPRLHSFKDKYSTNTTKWVLRASGNNSPYPLRNDFRKKTNDSKEFQAMAVLNKDLTYDSYLLGGREGWVDGQPKGKTVEVVDADTEYFDGVKGRIKEVNDSESKEGGSFDVVLGSFTDLRNIYANLAGTSNRNGSANMFDNPSAWKQVFIGQYTHKPRLSYPTASGFESSEADTPGVRATSIPLLAGKRIRPQTLHTLMNDKNQTLVRLYSLEVDGETVYYKYPAVIKIKLDGTEEESGGGGGSETSGFETTPDGKFVAYLPLASEAGQQFVQFADAGKFGKYDSIRQMYFPWGGNGTAQQPYYLDSGFNLQPVSSGWRDSDVKWDWIVPANAIRCELTQAQINQFGLTPENAGTRNSDLGGSGGGGGGGSTAVLKPGPGEGNGNVGILVPFGTDVSYNDLNSGNKGYGPIRGDTYFPWGAYNGFYWDAGFNWVYSSNRWTDVPSSVKDHVVPKHSFTVYVSQSQLDQLRQTFGDDVTMADGSGPKYEYRTATWTGYYVWASARFGNFDANDNWYYGSDSKRGSGFKLIKTDAEHPDRGEGIETITVPRIFFWQELMGFSLVKRRDSEGYGYPATYANNEEDGDKRTYFANAANGPAKTPDDRVKVGFDELLQGTTETNKIHPLFDRLGASTSDIKEYVQDRFDPIYVLEYDKNLVTDDKGEIHGYTKELNESNSDVKVYKSMSDFLFPAEFNVAEEEGGGKITRKAVKVFVGFEDQTELGSEWGPTDWDYGDLTFTIWIAPPEMVEGETTIDTVTSQGLEWWERAEEDGLTGLESNHALTANNEVHGALRESRENRLLENYKRLAFEEADDLDEANPDEWLFTHMWTMLDKEDWYRIGFNRAVFKDDFTIDETDQHMAEIIKAANTAGVKPTFYFTTADRLEFIAKDENDTSDEGFKARLESLNTGFLFEHVSKRWAELDDEERRELRAELVGKAPSSMNVPDEDVYARELARHMVGFEEYTVPGVETRNYYPVTNANEETVTKVFLAGEPVPVWNNNVFAGYSTSDTVPVNNRLFRIPEWFETSGYREDWIKEVTPGEMATKVYNEDLTGVTRTQVRNNFGLKDRRYGLGYHRGGDAEKILANRNIAESQRDVFADNYQLAYLYQPGWNPFMTTTGNRLAKEEQPKDDPNDSSEQSRYNYEFKYGLDNIERPQFVFDKHFDGAGTMVVNGDLIIRDTFAYHGVLIVLGDVIVEPTKKENEFIWSGGGWPVDKDNNPLKPTSYEATYATIADPSYDGMGKWEYVDPEEKGDVERPKNPQPLRTTVYRGDLHVQGQLIVKARLITKTVKVTDEATGSEKEFTGTINAYWSQEAVELVGGIWSVGRMVVERVSWTSDDNINVAPIWNDTVEVVTE